MDLIATVDTLIASRRSDDPDMVGRARMVIACGSGIRSGRCGSSLRSQVVERSIGPGSPGRRGKVQTGWRGGRTPGDRCRRLDTGIQHLDRVGILPESVGMPGRRKFGR